MVMTITGPAGELYVDDAGSGSGVPIVFLHSYAGTSAHWRAQLAHLRPRRRAVAMDLRGHGHSDKPPDGDYSVPVIGEDIAAVVDALELRRFVLVGHSLGGAAAAAYVGKHPQRVAGLVLAGAPGKAAPEEAKQVLASLQSDYAKTMAGYWASLLADAQPEVRERLDAGMHAVGREASMAIIGAILGYDPLPALSAYDGPKLIIDTPHGEGPTALHNQLPDINRKVIPGTSHWPHMDKPQEFNRLLDEFLAWIA
ncbi:MAG: alpha/beta hydrolase [Stagnimonas sp.]|nr:alpha/beta hydrolase [Stagnimonas sp.]